MNQYQWFIHAQEVLLLVHLKGALPLIEIPFQIVTSYL